MCSIQINLTSIIIPKYLAEYTQDALSMTKSLQSALFNVALWKTMKFFSVRYEIICWILTNHLKKSVQH